MRRRGGTQDLGLLPFPAGQTLNGLHSVVQIPGPGSIIARRSLCYLMRAIFRNATLPFITNKHIGLFELRNACF